MEKEKKEPVCKTCNCKEICFPEKIEAIDETDEARAYLLKFVGDNFKDKTFEKYIKTELAGDFIFNLVGVLKSMERIICDSEGCDQIAEFLDPLDNKLCSDCINVEVECGEYTYEECESLS